MPELNAPNCPQRETLSNFLLGKLDPQTSSECESHLAHCKPCVETISGLDVSDTFQSLVVASVGDNLDEPANGDESVVGNLIHRMIDVGAKAVGSVKSIDQRAADVVNQLDPSESSDAIGQIEHYRIEEVLGCGSTGVVFRAIDENLHRPVAIKVLRPLLGDAARERFIAEARATAILDHPNIVTIYQVGDSGSLAFIVMQWLPGETLEQRLERESVLKPESVKEFGQQIASGLAAAHEKGLVHRDIKPANLWITETDQVKILDFGLVRIMDESPQLTCTGMIAGTPCYMSPEQSRGDELDARSDLFSLGSVLYQCLTGKLPFASSNALATLQAVQRVQPVAPSNLDSATPADVSDLVMTLLEKSPHRRPDSANDLALAFGVARGEWPFQCDEYRELDRAVETKTQRVPKATVQSTKPTFWKAIALAAIAGVVGWGAFMFGPQIIRIATNQGEIVIQSNDPDVQVEVLRGGESIEIVDLKTKQSIQIESGNYQIRAVGDENSISIDRETLTLSRGESAIVTVTKKSSLPNPQNALTEIQLGSPLPSPLAEVAQTSTQVDPLHKVGSGDVLSVFIENVFGSLEDNRLNGQASLGLPVYVQSDGTISLPATSSIQVGGKTSIEIEKQLRSRFGYGKMISVVVQHAYVGNQNTLSEPVYDGMTFAQCLNLVKYERSKEKLLTPIRGVMKLKDASESPELIETMLTAVIRARGTGINLYLDSSFAKWLTDAQLQRLAVSISASDSVDQWALLSRVLGSNWKRLRPVQSEIIENTIHAMERKRIENDAPESVLISILKTDGMNAAEEKRIVKVLLDGLVESSVSMSQFEDLVGYNRDLRGLGEAVAAAMEAAIPQRRVSCTWADLLNSMGEDNQKAAVVSFAKNFFSRPNFNDHREGVIVLASLPDTTFDLIKPELKKALAAENRSAVEINSLRSGSVE